LYLDLADEKVMVIDILKIIKIEMEGESPQTDPLLQASYDIYEL
jgi:hypothetical protein